MSTSAASLSGHDRQRAEESGGDPGVGGATVHEQLDRLTTRGSLRGSEQRLHEERAHRLPPPSAQRTAPGSDTARGWVTGSPERGPHALGEDGHLRVELAAVGGEELEDQVL